MAKKEDKPKYQSYKGITKKKRLGSFAPEKTYGTRKGLSFLDTVKPNTGPWDKGKRLAIKDIDPATSDTWNMMLTNPGKESLYLWVDEMNIDFSMSGTFGQSRYRNQFFPRASNAPVMTIAGTAPNQYQYNLLALFIREAHYQALTYSSTPKAGGRTYGGGDYPLPTVRFMLKNAGKANAQNEGNTKGGHKSQIFEGYLKNIEAGVSKFQFARQFKFEVILAASTLTGSTGIYEDTLSTGSNILSWMTLFQDNQFGAKNWKQIQAADRASETADQKATRLKNLDTANAVGAASEVSGAITSATDPLSHIFKIT